jgi:hypothetical protein
VHLVLMLLNQPDQPEKAVGRFREFGLPDPVFLRARSTAAALSTEVPVFAGLRSLTLGADEDRLILLSFKKFETEEEVGRLMHRIQLEMNADSPPSGTIAALPLVVG